MRAFILTAAAGFVVTGWAFSNAPAQGPQVAPDAEREKPSLRVQEQADAPLRLSTSTKWATPDRRSLELSYTAVNVATKPIRAFAVRLSDPSRVQADGCMVVNIERPGKVLKPGESLARSTWRAAPLAGSEADFQIALDYVEFSDGFVWGVDACQTAELLRGLRAGARVAKGELQRILREKGIEALMSELGGQPGEVDVPPGQSEQWAKGYRGGVRSVRERVRRAHAEGGEPEVEEALRRPFDAADTP